ncbi:hypothetical protein [Novacetimonas sp. GS1]|uniref:hypothetical protein n=1 Tax=Novacetimonas TaxID=2919364 RepID=UPI002FCD0F94
MKIKRNGGFPLFLPDCAMWHGKKKQVFSINGLTLFVVGPISPFTASGAESS